MVSIYQKAQELGSKMLQLKEKELPSIDIWNNSQVYLGNTLSMITGDLYILDLCLKKMEEIKDSKTKEVFKNLIHLWALITLKKSEDIT